MRTLALGILVLTLGGCASLSPEESEQWDAALYAVGSALVQFGNQQMEAERWRQWQVQQSMPRQAICYNHGSYLSCTTY
jgi:hypothetical protein